MAWVRLDDSYDDNRKVVTVGYEAAWLNVRAIMWCNRNESDGHLPAAALDRFGTDFPVKKRRQLVGRLVEMGMWHDHGHDCPVCPEPEDDYVIHDYLEYQPTRARKDDDREAARERMRVARSNKRGGSEHVRGERPPKFAESSDNPGPGPQPVPKPEKQDPENSQSLVARTDFERFWAAYPIHIAKDAARRAWAKRLKSGADPEVLIAAAGNYATWTSRFSDPGYVKHAATWLNAGCETDELPERSNGKTEPKGFAGIREWAKTGDS